jgi:hypothetical protein
LLNSYVFARSADKLRIAMRADLDWDDIPDEGELDRMVDMAEAAYTIRRSLKAGMPAAATPASDGMSASVARSAAAPGTA